MKRYTLRAALHDAAILNQLRLEYRRANKNRRKDSFSRWLSRYLTSVRRHQCHLDFGHENVRRDGTCQFGRVMIGLCLSHDHVLLLKGVFHIVLRIPGRRITWRSMSDGFMSGVVSFEPRSDQETEVTFKIRSIFDLPASREEWKNILAISNGWLRAGSLPDRREDRAM